MANKIRCRKCSGYLVRVVEYLAGGSKLDVVKCVSCGFRVERRIDPFTNETEPANQPQPEVEKMAEKSTHGRERIKRGPRDTPPCASCNRPGMKIVGRGLCASCWNRHNKTGTLDQFEKVKRSGRTKKAKPAVPAIPDTPAEPATDTPVESTTTVSQVDIEILTQTPAAVELDGPAGVIVAFRDRRDQQLLDRLLREAHQARRSLDQQILFLVERQLAGEACDGVD